MDLEVAREHTRQAHEEAGVEAEAYAYVDQEDLESWGDPPELDEATIREQSGAPPEDFEVTADTVWVGAHQVWFMGGPGSRVYYRAANPSTGACYTQNASGTWLQRQFTNRCRSTGDGIWWILLRRP